MPKRALAEKRPFLLLSIAAALAFYYLRWTELPEFYLLPLKGAATALLAIYALVRHSSQDARLLALLMAVASAADMAAELDFGASLVVQFGYFVIALVLLLRHRRAALAKTQKWAVVALLLLPSVILYFAGVGGAGGYIAIAFGLGAGGMAAGAWASDFPRYKVGAGGVLVLASVLLAIFGQEQLAGRIVPQIFTFPLGFLGNFLIATGVIQTLRKRRPELRVVSSR